MFRTARFLYLYSILALYNLCICYNYRITFKPAYHVNHAVGESLQRRLNLGPWIDSYLGQFRWLSQRIKISMFVFYKHNEHLLIVTGWYSFKGVSQSAFSENRGPRKTETKKEEIYGYLGELMLIILIDSAFLFFFSWTFNQCIRIIIALARFPPLLLCYWPAAGGGFLFLYTFICRCLRRRIHTLSPWYLQNFLFD